VPNFSARYLLEQTAYQTRKIFAEKKSQKKHLYSIDKSESFGIMVAWLRGKDEAKKNPKKNPQGVDSGLPIV
jgi:hypothetical protein